MPGDISDGEHLARYVRRKSIITDRKDRSTILGCFPDAFRLRADRNEQYLSTARMETYEGTPEEQVSAILTAMEVCGFKIEKGSGFVVGNVGRIKSVCASFRALHLPKYRRPAYAEAWGVPQDDNLLLERIGRFFWNNIIPSGK